MALISVTRLHLRSWRYIIAFSIYTMAATRQIKRSRGFLAGHLGVEALRGFWTITAWTTEADMLAFRNSGAHRPAMAKLLNWCNEASFVHWQTDSPALPSMQEAHERLRSAGRVSKVRFPSPAHAAGRTVSEAVPREGLALAPKPDRAS
jgi:heme-degrading monooxygenase HmoA